MKILTYNILNGGLGRLDPIYETLLYLNADIAGLCEADDATGVRYLADKLSMDFVTAQGTGGRGVALLSRLPIRQMWNLSIKHAPLDKGAMIAEVETGRQPIRVVLTHLEAGQLRENEDTRLSQAETVMKEMAGEPMPTVWMGDFNSAAPYHPFDLEAASPKVSKRLEDRGTNRLDTDVVRRIERGGWVDAYHRRHPHHPKHTFTTGFPATRFDYIWLSPDLAPRLLDADVEQRGFAPYCSDHYPIWATLTTEQRDGDSA